MRDSIGMSALRNRPHSGMPPAMHCCMTWATSRILSWPEWVSAPGWNLFAAGDHQHALAAPYTCFEEGVGGFGECIRIPVKLRAVAACGSLGQKGTAGGRRHDGLLRRRFFVVTTCSFQHRSAGRGEIALHPQHRALPAGKAVLARVRLPGKPDHLRQRYPEHVPAGGIQGDAKPLIFGGPEDVGMGPADLFQRSVVGVLVMDVEHVAAEQRERILACELVPVLLEMNGGFFFTFVPQQIHHLVIRPGRTAPERPYPFEHRGHATAEIVPVRHVVLHELAQRQLGVMQLELTRLEEHTGIELVFTQPREEAISVGGGGDHDYAVAAPQARLQVQVDGVGEGLRVAMQLREVPVHRSFDQQRAHERGGHGETVGMRISPHNQSNGGPDVRSLSSGWTSPLVGSQSKLDLTPSMMNCTAIALNTSPMSRVRIRMPVWPSRRSTSDAAANTRNEITAVSRMDT